jgi:excisionase family DNA binding protein
MPQEKSTMDFLSVKEAADYIRVSTKRLYELKATVKDFPFHKIGEKLVFNRDELKAWVLAQ